MQENENNTIVNFWKSFEENHTLDSHELVNLLNEQVKHYSNGLVIEINELANVRELVLSPQGIKAYFAHAYELGGYAPAIEGWIVRAGRPPMGERLNELMDTFEIQADEVTFMPLESQDFPDDIAVRLYHKDYVAEEDAEQDRVVNGIYELLDAILGETTATFDFQYIDFDDMPHPKEQDYPLEHLAAYVFDKKSKRAIAGQEFPKEDIALLEGKVDELPTLLAVNNGLKYYEFMKEYPLFFKVTLDLKNSGENGLPQGNTDELYLVEDIIYQNISKKQRGHFIATETFNGKRDIFYYANSLESIETCIELLPKELETCEFNYEVHYDPFWVMTEAYVYM